MSHTLYIVHNLHHLSCSPKKFNYMAQKENEHSVFTKRIHEIKVQASATVALTLITN